MFEALEERIVAAAARRARARAAGLADRLRAELPRGITAAASQDGIALSGRDIAKRFALEPALRWMRFK